MQALRTRTIASVGSCNVGSGTLSIRTSPAAYIRVARLVVPPIVRPTHARTDSDRRLPCSMSPRRLCDVALDRDVRVAVDTEQMLLTTNDDDNRAAVKAVPRDQLNMVG